MRPSTRYEAGVIRGARLAALPRTRRRIRRRMSSTSSPSISRWRTRNASRLDADDDARAEASRRLGDVDAARRACREIARRRTAHVRRREWGLALGQDFRYAARSLRRTPRRHARHPRHARPRRRRQQRHLHGRERRPAAPIAVRTARPPRQHLRCLHRARPSALAALGARSDGPREPPRVRRGGGVRADAPHHHRRRRPRARSGADRHGQLCACARRASDAGPLLQADEDRPGGRRSSS